MFKKTLLYTLIIILLSSCNSTKNISYIYDTIYKTNTEIEYKYIHDSIYETNTIYQYIQGDTIVKEVEHTLYKYLTNIDTIVKVDSIYQSIEVPVKVVEYKKTYPLWPYIVCGILLILLYLYKKLFKK